MPNTVEVDGFTVLSNKDAMTISRGGDGGVVIYPAEVDLVNSLLSWGARLEGSPVYPSPLRSTPFELHIEPVEDEVRLTLKRKDSRDGLTFTFKDIDTLVPVNRKALDIHLNELKVGDSMPRVAVNQDISGPGDPFV